MAALALTPLAGATVSASFTFNQLTVTSNAADAIAIDCVGGQVKVNGANPGAAVSCTAVARIDVNGGPGANSIDLGNLSAADFPALAWVFVRGGAGDDTIRGTDLAVNETLYGDAGVDSVSGGGGNDSVNGDDDADTIEGGDGNDFLAGGRGDDSLVGGTGDDHLQGWLGNDALDGGDGTDTASFALASSATEISIDGLAGDGDQFESDNVGLDVENIEGSNKDDVIVGSPAANVLHGGSAGNDQLFGGGGNDRLDGGGFETVVPEDALDGGDGDDLLVSRGYPVSFVGGPGADTVDYRFVANDIQVSLDGVANDGWGGRDGVETDVETVVGGSGNDLLVGNEGANTLDGWSGNDVLVGGLGPDVLRGDLGIDTADYSARTADLQLDLDGDPDDGAAGENDTIGADVERLRGGDGDDVLTGAAMNDTFDGGPGADVMTGAGGRDLVDYSTRTGDVYIDLADLGADGGEVDENDATLGIEDVIGGAGDDWLIGDEGANKLDGGPGDDLLDGDLGADQLWGGEGIDVVDYRTRTNPVVVDLALGGSTDGELTEHDLVSSDVENALGGSGHDGLSGADFVANFLAGGPGTDELNGRGNHDILSGGPGADDLIGGEGWDLVDYFERTVGVTVVLDGLRGDGEPGENDLVRGDVEDVFGGSGPDQLIGDDSDNLLIGAAGDDVIEGRGGSDWGYGDEGGDTLRFRDGAPDGIDCGSEVDSVVADADDDTTVDCEVVDRPAPPPQPPPPSPLPPPPPAPPPPPRPVTPQCVVPSLKGRSLAQARRLLASKRCALGKVRRAFSARVRRGKLIAQSRRPGTRLPAGARVSVVVSRGRRR